MTTATMFEELYGAKDLVVQEYSSKFKFIQDISQLYRSGIVFSTVVSGTCHMRPEILPVSDCILGFKVLDISDGQEKWYKFIYTINESEPFQFT